MADIKISELGAALTVGDSDVLPMTASGVTSKVSTSLLKDYVIGTTDISAIGDGTVTGAIDAINTDMPDGLDDLDDVTITTPADGEAPVYDSVSQKFKNTAIVTQDEFGDVIAPIEVSPSAHAYSVGKQLLYNNVLYTVTSPIAVSDALTEGTNITASDTVIEQIEDNASDISDLNDAWQETGAYNLLKPGHASISDYGAIFVENADGTVTKSGTVSGGNAQYVFVVPTNEPYTPVANLIPGRKYKLVGCPSGGGDNLYEIYIQYRNADNTGWAEVYHDYGNGVEFTAKNARFGVYIRVFNGNADTLKFKPMITADLNATYDDYVPYAMTNRELTPQLSTATITQAGVAVGTNKLSKQGNVVNLHLTLTGLTCDAYANIGSIPTEYRPKSDVMIQAIQYNASDAPIIIGVLSASGYIQVRKSLTSANIATISATWTTN